MGQKGKLRHKYERRLTRQALAYERQLADQRFHEVALTQAEHRAFHEREHILYDDAIEKASSSVIAQVKQLDIEVDRLRIGRSDYMTTSRFEREHEGLIERINTTFAQFNDRLQAETTVTARQDAQGELRDKIATNNRWLVGIAITSLIGIATSSVGAITLILHLTGTIK